MNTALSVAMVLFYAADLIATIWARDFVPTGWRRWVPGYGFIAALDRVEAAHNSQKKLVSSFKGIRAGGTMTLQDSEGNQWSIMWSDDFEHVLQQANMKATEVSEPWTWKPRS